MIKCVIFDLDGTVSDTLSTIAYYGNMALEYVGLNKIDENEYKYFAGDGRTVLLHRMLKFLNSDKEELYEKLEKKYDFEYEKDVIGKTKPFDGIIQILKDLRKNGIKTAVLSNKPDNVTVDLVKKMYPDCFDVVHGKRNGVEAKPNPQGVYMTLEELGAEPNECIFVGDTDVDIFTAKNSNMKSIGVLWGFRDENELKKAGADYIIEKPSQILEIILKMKS